MERLNTGDSEEKNAIVEDLSSACGLYCGACGIYLATQENDTERLLNYAVVLNQSFDETLCNGCSSARKSLHCSKICVFIECKKQKGVSFCTDCDEFPCLALIDFKSKKPHRVELIESLHKLKEIGLEQWLIEMKEHYSCQQCQTVNSAYHLTCRKCGAEPGCQFVSQNRDLIDRYLSE